MSTQLACMDGMHDACPNNDGECGCVCHGRLDRTKLTVARIAGVCCCSTDRPLCPFHGDAPSLHDTYAEHCREHVPGTPAHGGGRCALCDSTAPLRRAPSCVFCAIVAGDAPADIVTRSDLVVVFRPLAPAVPGHVLVVPCVHVESAVTDTNITGAVFTLAANYLADLGGDGNLVTSVGRAATQTVDHLHVHVIPRGPGDGVHEDWPWHRALYDGIRRPQAVDDIRRAVR